MCRIIHIYLGVRNKIRGVSALLYPLISSSITLDKITRYFDMIFQHEKRVVQKFGHACPPVGE